LYLDYPAEVDKVISNPESSNLNAIVFCFDPHYKLHGKRMSNMDLEEAKNSTYYQEWKNMTRIEK
jgi:hypothetical protein